MQTVFFLMDAYLHHQFLYQMLTFGYLHIYVYIFLVYLLFSGLAFNSVDLGVNRISNFIHYDVIDGKPRYIFNIFFICCCKYILLMVINHK